MLVGNEMLNKRTTLKDKKKNHATHEMCYAQ